MRTLSTMIAVFAMLILLSGRVFSQGTETLKFSGDLRLRYEKDFSVTAKDDRDRARYRFRFGLVHKRGEHIEVGARLATGSPTDQQSPHQTFGDDFGKKNIHMDKAYFKYKFENGWFWVGKNGFPFWKQNEMFWDDDVNPEGVSVSYTTKEIAGEGSKLTFTGGQYIIDDFNDLFKSSLSAAQAALSVKAGAATITAAGGIFLFNNNAADSVSYNTLAGMDHNIFVAGVQAKFKAGNLPVKIGADFMKNLEDPLVTGFEDQTKGFVVQAALGQLKSPGDWLLAAYYAKIERFAVVPNFAQDDWWRFGSGHTDSSDLQGFELRAAYQPAQKMNLVARLYIAEMIEGSKEAKRFRLDFNIKY